MPIAAELLRQGKTEELWQMCCGFLDLNIGQFMDIQERLLLEQVQLLHDSPLGKKIMRGARPRTLSEFRRQVPLTGYADYCPELSEKREDVLPVKPAFWMHSSGRSAEYPNKWVPVTPAHSQELSKILYGIGMFCCAGGRGDTSRIPRDVKLLYSVAPKPYTSGTFADVLRTQSPVSYLPSLEESETLPFEDRIKLGFRQALSEGLDYFFGLSLVLVAVGEKFQRSSDKVDIRPFLTQPRALLRLARGKLRSRMAGRPMLPKDLWSVKGIVGSGIDSWVYKDKVKELWGRYPLDLYSCTEGSIIATQTWDYGGMTFIPNLNLLEFITEDEQLKGQLDRSYQPKTLLLDEVKAGETYEIVITSFHGGVMTRYRLGDIIRITSLRNEQLGIDIPQMAFERRTDDMLDFVTVKLTEKTIWQAIEKAGIAYEDWVAYKIPGEPVLHLLIEPKDGYLVSVPDMALAINNQILKSGSVRPGDGAAAEDWRNSIDFSVEVSLLPRGTFAGYIAQRQAEGSDLAHLKPPHLNPSDKVLTLLAVKPERVVVAARTPANPPETRKISV